MPLMPPTFEKSKRDAPTPGALAVVSSPNRRFRSWQIARAGLVVFLTACDAYSCEDALPARLDECRATLVTVTPNPVTLPVSATVAMSADVRLENNLGQREPCLGGTVIVGWESGNAGVASVGTIRPQQADIIAVATGSTFIRATVAGPSASRNTIGFSEIRVVPLVPSVRLSAAALTLPVGQTGSVTATVVDQDNRDITSRSSVTWRSSNETFATVNATSGVITGVAKGPATVTATATVLGLTASATLVVTVDDPPVQPVATLTLSGPSTVRATESIVLQATARNANGDIVLDPTLSWQSSAPTKATATRRATDAHKADVEGFLVGRVTVTAKAASGKEATMDVDVVPGPIATVTVTPPTATLRAGKTVQLSAVAKDARGNLVTTATFSWASSAPTLATVSNSGFVTAVAQGSPAIEATATGTTVTGQAIVSVTPKRLAYALADQPGAASYVANAATSFNSAGGSITITRQAAGSYQVSFPGQQPIAGEVETFIVSGYGASNGYCKIGSWGNGATTDLVANVRCFAFGGTPGDSPFTISLVSDESLGGRFGFGLADQPTVSASYVPGLMFNSSPQATAPPIRVQRTGVGRYAVTFTGNGGGPLDAEAIMVTAYGTGNERCQPGTLLIGESVIVNCWIGAAGESVPTDARFTVVLADRGRGGAQRSGFVYIDDSEVIAAGGSLTLPTLIAHNSTTGQVRVQDRGNGRFDITFDGLAANVGARFGVQVSDMDEDDSGYCSVSGWAPSGPNLVVSVTCWHEEDGTPDPDAFYLFVIQ